MAKSAVKTAVAARLAANFALGTILILNEDMLPPQDGAAWVRLEFPVAQNRVVTLGRRYREEGSFRVVVAVEVASGTSKMTTWCEAIEAIFRNQYFSGVKTWSPTINEGVDDGIYFMASVIVPYRYEYSD